MQTDVIDAYLDENQLLVEAVAQAQNRGRLHDAVHYQIKLHQNLIHLALAADQSPHLQRMDINPPDDTPEHADAPNPPSPSGDDPLTSPTSPPAADATASPLPPEPPDNAPLVPAPNGDRRYSGR